MRVLLVHGLGRTPLSLFWLARSLRSGGHSTRFFAYSPTFERLDRIVRRLTRLLHELSRIDEPVALIGHSLGGLLLRMALPTVHDLNTLHLIMLGTPNRAPRLARLAWRWLPFRLLTGTCGQFLATPRAFGQLRNPGVSMTVIAGTAGPRGRFSPFGHDPNDGVVAVSETQNDSIENHVQFPVWHTLMMNAVTVQAHILALLQSGSAVFSNLPRQVGQITKKMPIV
ncbi:MAG TPA: alpha/beta fold hydrolase [Gemmata sp.]|nr:alpha/beta fold hydrolase [Gemmata sp.]